jgi:hypothetical protein
MSDDVSVTDVNDMIERPYCKPKGGGMLAVTSGGPTMKPVKGKMIMSQLHGQKYLEADPEDYAAFGSSPSDAAVLIIDAEDCPGSATYSVWCTVLLEYSVICMGRKDPGASSAKPPMEKKITETVSNNNPVSGPDHSAIDKRIAQLQKELDMLKNN